MPRNGSPVWSACLRAVVDKHKTSLISMDDSGLEAIFLDLGGMACLKAGKTATRARARATLASALDRKGIKRVPTAQDKAAVCMMCGFVVEHCNSTRWKQRNCLVCADDRPHRDEFIATMPLRRRPRRRGQRVRSAWCRSRGPPSLLAHPCRDSQLKVARALAVRAPAAAAAAAAQGGHRTRQRRWRKSPRRCSSTAPPAAKNGPCSPHCRQAWSWRASLVRRLTRTLAPAKAAAWSSPAFSDKLGLPLPDCHSRTENFHVKISAFLETLTEIFM